ncbi:MAG: DNA repair protein RecO [Mariprofundus sp.]|nr:DNA repair protein RecO [Mariprofundus sp.]
MAEFSDCALLIRRIPYGETSLICHFFTEKYGRITLMVRGARRPKSDFRACLEPLHTLQISWRCGRTGMGTLVDIQRGQSLLQPSFLLDGLELLAIASRLFQEGDPHGFGETTVALTLLAEQGQQQGLMAAVWYLLDVAGWLGDLSHCWQCGREAEQTMFWQHARLVCDDCGQGMPVSVGLRKSITAVLSGGHILLGAADAGRWRDMISGVLNEHGIKVTDSFKGM